MAKDYMKQQQNHLKVYLNPIKIYLLFMEQRKEKVAMLLAFTLPVLQFLAMVSTQLI